MYSTARLSGYALGCKQDDGHSCRYALCQFLGGLQILRSIPRFLQTGLDLQASRHGYLDVKDTGPWAANST
jgi:hypothetical protein